MSHHRKKQGDSNFKVETSLVENTVIIDVDIDLESRNRMAVSDVTVRLPELGLKGSVTAGTGERSRLTLEIKRSRVQLWSPDDPKLYTVELETEHETITDQIGLREVSTDGGKIMLNGEEIRLYGLCVHSEFPETGRTATPEGIDQMIAAANDLGVNFLRCAHYPYSAEFGRAMDATGLRWCRWRVRWIRHG